MYILPQFSKKRKALFTKTGSWPSGHGSPTPDLNSPLAYRRSPSFISYIVAIIAPAAAVTAFGFSPW